MARPPIDLPPAAAIHALADREGRLAVHVTPGARMESLVISDGQLVVKVRARPHGGAANAAVLGLLASALDCPPSALRLLRGATSRKKVVRLP